MYVGNPGSNGLILEDYDEIKQDGKGQLWTGCVALDFCHTRTTVYCSECSRFWLRQYPWNPWRVRGSVWHTCILCGGPGSNNYGQTLRLGKKGTGDKLHCVCFVACICNRRDALKNGYCPKGCGTSGGSLAERQVAFIALSATGRIANLQSLPRRRGTYCCCLPGTFNNSALPSILDH